MPRDVEDVETFLHRLNRNFERNGDFFLVSSASDGTPIAIRIEAPIALVRVDIGPAPVAPDKQSAIFRKLLEYNGSDLVHVAYALDQNEIVLSTGVELENLDLNELAAVLSDIDLALMQHVGVLRELAREAPPAGGEASA